MSNSRQSRAKVRSYSITHPQGHVMVPTQPGWDHLVFAYFGVFTAVTDTQTWTVPAHRALCVPAGTPLQVNTTKRVAIGCLYLDQALEAVGRQARVVNLAPLNRELLSHVITAAPMDLSSAAERAAITLLTYLVANERDVPLQLAMPDDPVARQVADEIIANPALRLDDCLGSADASRRTIERRFTSETGMSLGQWRRRARILAAVSELSQGESVTSVAASIGYATPSSLVAAFKSELGVPPREFLSVQARPKR